FSASGRTLTHPLNLPAPGRCQPLYFAFLASQRPVFLINSRLGLFTAAYSKSKHPFSLSYGVILPSSLTRVLPLTFGYSPCLPGLVSGTGTCNLTRGVSRQGGIRNFDTKFLSPSQLEIVERIFLFNSLTAWAHTSIGAHSISSCVSPSFKRLRGGTGISTCCPSPTPFGLSLGPTNPDR